MKIRHGFISNSSSASFIVTVKMDKEQLCGVLSKELGWSYVGKYAFKTILKTNIEEHKEHLENNKKELESRLLERKENSSDGDKIDRVEWAQNSIEWWENVIKEEENLLEKIDRYNVGEGNKYNGEEDYIKLIQDALLYHHVKLKPLFKSEAVWEFSSCITMFNSYDDIPTLLKEIILMFAFENHEVKCVVQGDD